MPRSPKVDLVVAVHDPARPVERAVHSVVEGTRAAVRVTVVCHGIDPAVFKGRLQESSTVRIARCDDGLHSPAGPFNHGLDLASAPYTAVMGSDDLLEPGAVDSWLRRASRDRADVVIARTRHASGQPVHTPVTRPWRTRRLDGVRDRLAYRSAPLGLVSRERFGDLRFVRGVPVGEDIAYVNELWYSGAAVSLDRGPAYVIHDDAPSRVSFSVRPVSEELGVLPEVLRRLQGARAEQIQAYATKFLRVQIFGAVHHRNAPELWTESERAALAGAARAVLAAAPRAAAPLSLADRTLLDAVLDPEVSTADLLRLGQDRRRFGRPATLVPRELGTMLHREAPLRFMAASVLAGISLPGRR